MSGALHAFEIRTKTRLETRKVNQARHQNRDLDARALGERCDELLNGRQEGPAVLVRRRDGWRWKKALVERGFTPNDFCGLLCEV